MNIDLHIHTDASDGSLKPAEVVRAAAAAGLEVIAIADHDTTDGLPEALEAGRQCGIEVVPGVEVSATDSQGEVHILGYWIDYRGADFRQFLHLPRSTRPSRIVEMCRKLTELGMDIDPGEVFALAGEQGSVGRAHLARVLVGKGFVRDFDEAFRRYLANGAPAYVGRFKNSISETIARIHRAGGVSIIAHPGLIANPELVQTLIAQGVMGLEAYCHEHSEEQTQGFLRLARERGLVATGGSDFHGEVTGQAFRLGDLKVPYECFVRLRQARDRLAAGKAPAGTRVEEKNETRGDGAEGKPGQSPVRAR